MPDVFISYNREDRETARLVASALEAEGASVWWDAALRAGETYDEVTEQNLRTAGAVVVLWSKRSSNSKWVRAEATVGERSSTLVPALIEDCERPIRFELVQTADLRHWRGDRNDPHWRAFMQDIRAAVAKRATKQQPQASAPVQSSAPAPDASIETAFWNSIKDGADAAEFDAYLKRYPNGHFAALAQNRLAALRKPAPQPTRPAQPAAQPVQRPQAAPQAAVARPQPAPARPAAAPQPAKKSGAGLIFGGIAAALLVLGGAGFMLMQGQGGKAKADAAPAAAIAATEETKVAVTEQETAPGEDFVDVFDDGAANSQSTDESVPIDIEGAPLDLAAEEAAVPAEAPETADEAVAEISAPPQPSSAPSERPSSAAAATATERKVSTAKTFRDCESCPLMARIPSGEFVMGSPEGEPGRNAYEGPQLKVKVPAFAIGVYEVTNAEWNACADDGACPKRHGDANLPALGLSWSDASSFAAWLSKKTGRKYRLPSEAEWEYAARAGTISAYWWGERFDKSRVTTGAVAAVGASDQNPFGLYDMIGNAREWVADCYVNNFSKLPTDGSPSTEGDCGKRVIRGGAWSSAPVDLRIANRSRIDAGVRAGYMGLRIAAEAKK